MKEVTAVVFILIVAIFSPFILIWGVNELLEQAQVVNQLPYNGWTWLASLAVGVALRGGK